MPKVSYGRMGDGTRMGVRGRTRTRCAVGPACLAGMLALAAAATALAQAPIRSASGGQEGSLEARVTRIEHQLSSKALFELLDRLDALQRDVQSLRGDLELQSHDMAELKERQRDLAARIERVAGRLDSTSPPPVASAGAPGASGSAGAGAGASASAPSVPAAASASAGVEAGTPAGTAQVAPVGSSSPRSVTAAPVGGGEVPGGSSAGGGDALEEQGAYAAAFNLLKEGKYEKAAESFQQFLRKYPAGQYSDNAQYWLGEAYYVTRNFPRSMEEFKKLVAQYPQSAKVPGAQLKIGFIHQELGELDQAKAVLSDLVARYPRTTAARLARDRLSQIATR